MDKDFNQVNKQIASFIILTTAVAAPVVMPSAYGEVQTNSVVTQEQIIPPMLRYAGPQMPPSGEIIARYAGPQMPLPTVRYAGPQMPPIMVKYAGPQMPSPSEIMERYAGPQMQGADVNLNFDQNVNIIPDAKIVPNSNINVKPVRTDNNFGLIQLDTGHYIYK